MVPQDNETEQDSKSNGRNNEEVDRGDLSSVILQKDLPGRLLASHSVLGYG
jgi:hypothetical protein